MRDSPRASLGRVLMVVRAMAGVAVRMKDVVASKRVPVACSWIRSP